MRFTTPLLILLGAALTAQSPTLPHVVLTELPSTSPKAQLVEVDPLTGTPTPMPRFASDTLQPLAVTFDAIDGAILVALDVTGSQSSIVRLDRVGSTFVESPVATVPGRVVELLIAGSDLVAATDATNGGLWRIPRRGGTPFRVLQQGNLTAMHAHFAGADTIEVAWTGRAGTSVTSSGTGLYDIGAQQWVIGPNSFPNPNGVEVSGVIDMPTALIRQFLSFSDGSFAMFTLGALQPVPTSPVVPPGGAAALHPLSPFSVASTVVGGATNPFLYEVDPFYGTITRLSTMLPGDPIDFAGGISLSANVDYFGEACGATALSQWNAGLPQLGSTVTVGVNGPPNTTVLLVGGLDDFGFGTFPYVLPSGGCLLETQPGFTRLGITASNGNFGVPISLPAAPTWAGTSLFLQWAHFDVTGLSASGGSAYRIGF